MTNQSENWRQWVAANLLPQANGSATLEAGPVNPAPFSVGMHSVPSFDLLGMLPEGAAAKLRALRQRSADGHAIIPPFEDLRQASLAKVEAANALRRLTDRPQDHGFGLPPSDARVIAAEKFLAKEADKFDRIKALQELRAAAWQAASAALAACEGYLRHNVPGNCTLEDAEEVEPKLAKNETVLDGIERLRRRCREAKADLHRIQSAPYPSSHAKAQMREIVEQLATRGAPGVSLLIEHNRQEICWPMTSLRSEVLGGEHLAVGFAEVPDTVALLAWLHKDALIKGLDAEIDAEGDDASALTHADREVRIAEAEADLLSTERDICALIWRGQAEGLPVEFPTDISPQALLDVTLVTTPRADGLPETSPGLSWDLRR